ncbi:hypothetical protein [Kangiella sp. HZ709]|uniref:hypothetical protein n=1 Tax=Kangiella sp. HZ709 TaxID=2666328 RepID=UPI0012AFA997|nr:hypothetical protein [Kangiella sp. HZ709]MRX27172.1 hypothetical protein [Kangiella sp. HZ709]
MKAYLFAASTLFFSLHVSAERTVQECMDVKDNAKRLACYDSFFKKQSLTLPTENTKKAPQKTESLFGLEQQIAARQPNQLNFKLQGKFKRWKKGMKLNTAEGQIWLIKGRHNIYYPIEDPKIIIRKGSLGSYLMNIEGLNTTFKVKRVK